MHDGQMMKMDAYERFLQNKITRVAESGFDVKDSDLNDHLFDFQRWIVKTALKKGRYAVFADCGLGKTLIQLEWADKVVSHTKKPVLILAPLAVSGQTIKEGEKFGIKVSKYSGIVGEEIYISNYEQLENIDCSEFGGVVLDESSILKNFTGVYKTLLIEQFKETPFKLCCTATPSPNDVIELTNHSEFIGWMPSNEMLAMYFVHDGGVADDGIKWRLKGHAESLFWSFVASWSVMLAKPSDIGFSAEGYDLPALNFIEKKIHTAKRDNGMLFNDTAVSATNFNQELRLTKVERLSQAAEIVNASDEPFIIWIKQNEEADYIKSLIPDAVEVRGNESPEAKEKKLLGFANGDFRVLVTKAKIAQFGLNYQHCHNQVFASLDFSFEGLYQAVRRSYRFGQTKDVNIYLITTDTMQNVVDSIERKERQFQNMQAKMVEAINTSDGIIGSYTSQTDEFKTDDCLLRKGDCIRLIKDVADESIGFSIFSPPFASLFTYSDHVADMGNSADYDDFMFAFKMLVSDLFRVTMYGRNVAVHCMDLPIQKGKEGYIGLRDFSGMILQAFTDAGFIYHSRVTIWKDPVTEMQRTKALGLLYKQVKKDSAMSRVGLPDYLMVFRKGGEHANPVRCEIDVDTWQKYASPVWFDIDYGKTLNGREGRHENDERHICPLQLQTIERAITLWSNAGDTVLTPFAGIGSEVYQALKMNRKAIGFELKDSYFDIAVKNARGVLESRKQASIFELLAA